MEVPNYDELSARLKLLAHPERLRILDAVRRDSECVCHLEALLGKPQPYVSQQLRLLRDAGVIIDEKQGQNVFYRLCDDAVRTWLDVVLGPSAGEHPHMAQPKPDAVLEEDKAITAFPLKIKRENIRIVPVTDLFVK